MLTQPGGFSSPFAMALASQLQGGPFHHLASLQQHLNSLAQSASSTPSQSASSTPSIPMRKPRMGGTTVKTAKVWKYFEQLPVEEQAAECQLCRKKIKATNSSTTGMIRHLRSCHVNEYQQLQEARQNSLIVKMADSDERTRAQLLKDVHSVASVLQSPPTSTPKPRSPQLSPHSASDSGVSESSSLLPHPSSPSSLMNLFRHLPPGLPAPKPILPHTQQHSVKMEVRREVLRGKREEKGRNGKVEVETEEESGDHLSERPPTMFPPRKTIVDSLEERRINTQIALMLLLDSCPSSIVDRPGFRGLIKMLLPFHNLPAASRFDSDIIPDVIARLKADMATPFATNNPSRDIAPPQVQPSRPVPQETAKSEGVSDVEQVMAAMRAASNISQSFSHSIELRKDEDSDSSSSADSETSMPARIDSFLNFIGRYVFPHEDVVNLLTICRSWMSHFEEIGQHNLLVAGLSIPHRIHGQPELARDVAFVAENVDTLNAYVSIHPEMELSPITESQTQFIRDLHAHITAM